MFLYATLLCCLLSGTHAAFLGQKNHVRRHLVKPFGLGSENDYLSTLSSPSPPTAPTAPNDNLQHPTYQQQIMPQNAASSVPQAPPPPPPAGPNPATVAGPSSVQTPGVSISGVSHQQVIQGLDILYPPTELSARNAKSRTDGYWPFIQGAESKPPQEFTYGEFDAQFFADLLDQAAQFMDTATYDNKVVCDIGSGTGRLVLGAAALHPNLASSQGIEILPGINEVAVQNVANCQGMLPPHNLPLAPIDLTCGSAAEVDISTVDVFFMFSSCMPANILEEISQAIGQKSKVGTLVICTEYELTTERTLCQATGRCFQLEKLAQTDGECSVVGGVSTAYTYKLIESASASGLQDTSLAPPTESASTATATSRTHSTSGVSYEHVADCLDTLYPPSDLASRNAKSRTDGYWPFIKGADSEAPVEFTYGEFDALFFAQLLDQATTYMDTPTLENKVVCDVGSGAGRLVLGAAALYPGLKQSRGVEILPGIHDMAVEVVSSLNCQGLLKPHNLPLAPIELTCGSISDPTVADVSNVDLFFIASTCMPENVLIEIAHAIGRQCRVGTLVIGTDYELITERSLCQATGKYFQLQKLAQTDGYCWVVGGVSTAFTYQLIESAA